MKVSENGLSFIAKWEGEVLHPYNDIAGIPTIGIGHVIRPGEHFGTITHEQAMDLLASDIAIAEQAVNDLGVDLNQNQWDACVSLCYNIGVGAFSKSTLVKDLKEGRYGLAAEEFLHWCHAGGRENAGLLNRRKAERELFLRPVPAQQMATEEAGRIMKLAADVDACREGLPE